MFILSIVLSVFLAWYFEYHEGLTFFLTLAAIYLLLRFTPVKDVKYVKKAIEWTDIISKPVLAIFDIYFGESEKRIREDVLNSKKTQSKIVSDLGDNQSGVFVGRLIDSDKKLFIDSSDRACVIGPPGTGKTTFMINQLYHWLESGNSFVCLDIKPEIYNIAKKQLKKAGYKCYVFNPTSPKDKYNFLDDLTTPEAIGEVASAFIPSDSMDNAVFNETARDFLDAIIAHLKAPTNKEPNPKPTLPDVYDFVISFDSSKALLNTLAHSNSEHARAISKTLKIMAGNERLLGSIFATFVSNMRFLRYESVRDSLGKNGFSLDVLQNKKIALFLQFEEAQKATTSHLFSVMVGHMLRYLIINYDREPVLLLLDEIGNAGLITDLTGKLNTIRSRKLPTWLYWQSTEQMQKYGKKADEGPNIIMGACDLQMCFRLNDNATAKWFSEKIGTQENTMISSTDGTSSGSNRSIVMEAIIDPHEIQQLKMSQVLCSYRGSNWIGEATPYFKED